MIFIWRGWGILALLYAIAAFVGVMLLTDAVAPDGSLPFFFGIGLLLAAAATWFTGAALNRTMPQRKLEALTAARKTQLTEHVENGTFSRGPGHPLPQTQDEARLLADALLTKERTEAMSGLYNRHTLFFIPMQYWGFVLGALAIVSLISDASRNGS